MKNILSLEIRKFLYSKKFWIIVLVGCFFTCISGLYQIGVFDETMNSIFSVQAKTQIEYNVGITSITLFNRWIGGERQSLGFSAFFFIFPLLMTLPYGDSYCVERNIGYERNVIIRCGRVRCFLSKYIAVFLSGALAFTIPLLFNFIMVSLFVPSFTPDSSWMLYYGMTSTSMLSNLFFTRPFLYILIYFIIDFIFGGLIACLALFFSLLVRNRFVVVILPFLCILFIHYCRQFLMYVVDIEISPLYFLHAALVYNSVAAWVIILEGIVFFLLTFLTFLAGRVKCDVY